MARETSKKKDTRSRKETTARKAVATRKTASKRTATKRTATKRTAAKRTATKRTATRSRSAGKSSRKSTTRSGSSRASKNRSQGTRGGNGRGEIRATNLQAEDRKYVEKYGKQLSPSTLRAKWAANPEDHQDRPGQTMATRSHEVIQQWAEERGAVPMTVPGTEHGQDLGVLRFNFPGFGGGNLQEVSWEDWFRTFDHRNLVFVYQENKKDGAQSNFFKLDNPNREDG